VRSSPWDIWSSAWWEDRCRDPAQGGGPEWSARSVYPGAHAVLTVSAIAILGAFVAVARTLPSSAPELTTVLRVAGAVEFLTVAVLMKLVTAQI